MSMNFEGEKKVTNKSRNQFHSSRTHWPVRSTKTWNRQLTVDDRRRSALESLKIHRNTWNNCSARRAEVRRWVAEFFSLFHFPKKPRPPLYLWRVRVDTLLNGSSQSVQLEAFCSVEWRFSPDARPIRIDSSALIEPPGRHQSMENSHLRP